MVSKLFKWGWAVEKIKCDIFRQIWNVCIIWSDYVVEGYRHVCFVGLGSVQRLADSYWPYGG